MICTATEESGCFAEERMIAASAGWARFANWLTQLRGTSRSGKTSGKERTESVILQSQISDP